MAPAPEKWFIHIDDPGFPDPPWPGQRRLGPLNSREEALAQAVSDAAVGMGAAAVFDEAGSEALREGRGAKATHTVSEVRRLGEAERRRREKLVAHELLAEDDRDRQLQAVLGDAVKVSELREAGLLR